MNTGMKNALKVGLPLLVMMALVLGSTLPVLAKNTWKPAPAMRALPGEVVSISSDNSTSDNATITIQTRGQQLATFKVDANTKYYLVPNGKTPAAVNNVLSKATVSNNSSTASIGINPNSLNRYGKAAKFSDIQIGDKVIAWVKTDDNIATKILIIKPPIIQKVKGTITAVSDNSTSITITPISGNAVTFKWDANTKFVLKGLISVQTGQYAAAVYNRITMLASMVDVQATAPASDKRSD